MLTESEILYVLDNYRNHEPCFVELGHPYDYLIDGRINIFKGDNDRWAIAVEVFSLNVNAVPIGIDITYYGNCLINGEEDFNTHFALPVDAKNYDETIEFEELKPDAKYWLVRGQKIPLSHNKQDYIDAGVISIEDASENIRVEQVARYLITTHQDLFRATDEELYHLIPKDLKKILVIDEWHHRDFHYNGFYNNSLFDAMISMSNVEDTPELRQTLINSPLFEGRDERISNDNKYELENNRPGAYETWQMIAKVIATGDTSFYKPTLEPNSHWKNWKDGM